MDALDQVRARWIVGADGIQSRVRRWAGLQQLRRDARRFSYRQHYRIAPWSEYVEVHWANKCQFYVTPVSTNEVCLVLLTRDPRQRLADALPQFPSLARRLAGCSETSSERGALAATRRLTRVTSGNAALIGDASGTVDPISGEGICLAFKQALALADALAHGSLRQYEQAHIEICRRPRLMSEFMLLMDRSNFLQRRAMESFTRAPHLFSNLVASHAGQGISVDLLKTAVALGWHVATQ